MSDGRSFGDVLYIFTYILLNCYLAARELGISQIQLSKQLNLSPTAITFAVKRGERLDHEMNVVLE